ncbi:Uncharacterised protein [Streptococcus pneumoniae]|nr:Uncharacterised protein [Streptococcus pneumoniae]CJI83804.1 Uncharacterised protein [Streptococcus pneumoniae]
MKFVRATIECLPFIFLTFALTMSILRISEPGLRPICIARFSFATGVCVRFVALIFTSMLRISFRNLLILFSNSLSEPATFANRSQLPKLIFFAFSSSSIVNSLFSSTICLSSVLFSLGILTSSTTSIERA